MNLSILWSYFKKRTYLSLGYEPEQGLGRAKFISCEFRVDSKDVKKLKTRYDKILPINETPYERFFGKIDDVVCRVSFYFESDPSNIYHYLFNRDDVIAFPINPGNRPPSKIVSAFVWDGIGVPFSVMLYLKTWGGPYMNFFDRAIPTYQIFPNIPENGWNLFYMTTSGHVYSHVLTKDSFIQWPLKSTEINVNEFQFIKKLSNCTKNQLCHILKEMKSNMMTEEQTEKKNSIMEDL